MGAARSADDLKSNERRRMQNVAKRLRNQHRRSQFVLYGLTLPLLAFSLATATDSVLRIVYVILGFSLIIFLHELGHFVVARSCSVKCLAFSLGIGPRMFGWRKGAGFSFGNDPFDPDTAAKKLTDEKTSGDPGDGHTLEHLEAATTHSDIITSATEPPHPSSVGVTDYRVSWLPLGGYVRMLGQDDMDPTKVSSDPRAFNNRPIWQRMCIVSAGVIMNLIFAAVTFTIIFSPGVGVDFPPAQLGQVVYDSPAWKAGLHMGDRIVAIDGDKPTGAFLEFTDVMIASALSSGNDKIKFDYIPYGETETKSVEILPEVSPASGFLAIGAESLIGTKIGGSGEEYAKQTPATINTPELSKIREGDEIVAVDGVDVRDNYMKLYQHIQAKNGAPVELTLDNDKNQSLPPLNISIVPRLEPRLGVKGFPPVLGLSPRVVLGTPQHWSAATAADLRDGDAVLQVGDRTNPTTEQFIDVVSNSAGKPLDITVDRDGVTKTVTATPKLVKGKGMLGITLAEDPEKLTFNVVGKSNGAESLDLPTGAVISAINGHKVESWFDIYGDLRNEPAGTAVPVTFTTAKGDLTKSLTLSAEDADALDTLMHYELGMQLAYRTETQRGANAGQAVIMGVQHTEKFILQVYMTLAGLARRTVSPSNLHGIVGIAKIGYDAQERGPVWLWYILALVSVNLAVANFLPLPIVDGGLFLLLIVEKIRGKPLSLKVQSAIQVVGLVLLAGLFLFVTVNDLSLF
jgi:regulator of sigma E protease